MKKRLFSVLLVLIMSLSLLSTVYAESPPTIKEVVTDALNQENFDEKSLISMVKE